MSEYSSLKVPELKKLLAEKNLPQTGNKADLIARLQENDQAAGSEDKLAAAPKEDEISYSDDDAVVASAPKAPKEAAPAPEATKVMDDATETKEDAVTKEPADANGESTSAAPAPSFAMGLSSTAADDEAKKRADRAKRFGIEEEDDAKKRADRATRFGLDEKELASGLDAALPERPLKRGRGRVEGEGNRSGKKQSLDRRERSQRNTRSSQSQGKSGGGKASGVLDDPSEKAKADKRAARFAAA